MENNTSKNQKILEIININKEFPGVKALSDFNFNLYKGEIHCIIGENGAGKSTFIKILSGAFQYNSGDIYIEGEKYESLDPRLAGEIGIQTVYQEDILIRQISAAENIFLGSSLQGQKFFIKYNKIIKKAYELASQLGVKIKVEELYENLSSAEQQFVKILKALAQKPKILILDEPTQAFNTKDIGLITEMVKKISNEGVSIIYIAHNLDEVIEVADRITVLRDGYKIITHDNNETKNITAEILAKEMIGRSVSLFYKKAKHPLGDYVFEVKGLKLTPLSKEINLKIKVGEILGFAGLKGAGRSEIVRAIFGASKKYQGKIYYDGKEITPNNPKKAVKAGLALLTENKKIDGLFMGMPVGQNITIVGIDKIGKLFINLRKEKKISMDFVKKLRIKIASLNNEVKFLSGGNQQKVVLAKWLFKGVNVLIVDEPTHGIDVNAKAEVYELFTELAASGKSILMISSEMPELISLSDRVIVLKDFEITRELTGSEITEENILLGFMGGKYR